MIRILSIQPTNHGNFQNLSKSLGNTWQHETVNNFVDGLIVLPRDEVVLLINSFDMLCLRSSHEFIATYKNVDKDIVVGATCIKSNVLPDKWWIKHGINTNKTKYKYPDFSFTTGTVQSLLDWLQSGLTLIEYLNTHTEKVWIDIHHDLFFTDVNGDSTDYRFRNQDHSLILSTGAKIHPFFIHFPDVMLKGSMPFRHLLSPKTMFLPGKNYSKIGKELNGPEHIDQLPANPQQFQKSMWAERSVYLTIALILFFSAIIVFVRSHYS